MSSTLEHFSHPKHSLRLKEDDVIGEDATCNMCNKTVIGSPTYTCTSLDDIVCQSFYLHRSCAELPTQIFHSEHNEHPLALVPRPDYCFCDVCDREVKFPYSCEGCDIDVCVVCAFAYDSEQRVICHEGHGEHILKLQREALFMCDACGVKAEDYSYVCIACDFWIHKICAFLPLIIPAPTYHHHPLNLIYSVPDMHRYFNRFCAICDKLVRKNNWMYYCHKCTYFVHMKCASSSHILVHGNEADGTDNELDLIEFPLPREESLFDLIRSQCGRFEVDFQGKYEDSVIASIVHNDQHIIEEHWSHKNHSLEQLQLTTSEDDDELNDNDDRRVLICDGCIQPITISQPSYYACIQCGFFLHPFCATKLPLQLPAGAIPFHPQHSFFLWKADRFFGLIKCGACSYSTNGFYYQCETCDAIIDIRCAFLPTRIKHKSHKHHSLVQRPFSGTVCSISKMLITSGLEYACETCSNFHMHINCTFYPSQKKHKYDLHTAILRHPPFFYEGVFYCEICEEQVNNRWLLYHCDECDHSFHNDCLCWNQNVKFGGMIKLTIGNQQHKLALVLKSSKRKNSRLYFCDNCDHGCNLDFFFECDGCGFLACLSCAIKLLGE